MIITVSQSPKECSEDFIASAIALCKVIECDVVLTADWCQDLIVTPGDTIGAVMTRARENPKDGPLTVFREHPPQEVK